MHLRNETLAVIDVLVLSFRVRARARARARARGMCVRVCA